MRVSPAVEVCRPGKVRYSSQFGGFRRV